MYRFCTRFDRATLPNHSATPNEVNVSRVDKIVEVKARHLAKNPQLIVALPGRCHQILVVNAVTSALRKLLGDFAQSGVINVRQAEPFLVQLFRQVPRHLDHFAIG